MNNDKNTSERTPMTREEAMARFMAAKRHKKEMVERSKIALREHYIAMYGIEPQNLEVW